MGTGRTRQDRKGRGRVLEEKFYFQIRAEMSDKNLGSSGGGKKARKGLISLSNPGGLALKHKSTAHCCVPTVGSLI